MTTDVSPIAGIASVILVPSLERDYRGNGAHRVVHAR